MSVEKYAYIAKGREPDQIVRRALAQVLPRVARGVDHIVAPVVNLFFVEPSSGPKIYSARLG